MHIPKNVAIAVFVTYGGDSNVNGYCVSTSVLNAGGDTIIMGNPPRSGMYKTMIKEINLNLAYAQPIINGVLLINNFLLKKKPIFKLSN